jgi:hypothetical protein
MEVLMGSGVTTPVLSPVMRAGGSRGTRKQVRRSDQCWEVTEADLNMYAMIVGRPPSEAEKLEALTRARRRQERADAQAVELAGRRPAGSAWSPMVLCDYLRGICNGTVQLRIGGPVFSAWVRNLSIQARQRLQETQARLTAARAR